MPFRRSHASPCRTGPWLLLAALLALPACSFAPEVAVPQTVKALPDTYEQADTLADYEPVAWWQTYRDPVLDRLVTEVLAQNLDLVEAAARVEQVRAQRRIARSALYPNVQAEVRAQRQSQPANTGIGGQFGRRGQQQGSGSGAGDGAGGDGREAPPGDSAAIRAQPDPPEDGQQEEPQQGAPARFSFTTYSAALSFSYEVDFWGRVRHAIDAAEADLFASLADLHMVRLQVISETMRTYFEIVELEQLIDLTRDDLQLLEERLELSDLRYVRGLVSTFELYGVRQQYRQVQAQLPQLRSRLYDAEARLGVLLGGYVDPVDSLLAAVDPLEVRLSLDPIPAGLPSTLLTHRPDVVAAFQRLEAARFDVGVRRAERLPQLSLTGSAGVQSDALSSLVDYDQRFSSFAAALTAPLFAGGRLEAQVDASEARYRQQAAVYARTVLTAFSDVETALKNYHETREQYLLLQERLQSAAASVRLQRQRYTDGVGDFLGYVDARRNYAGVLTTLVSTERALAVARLAVHRALGGAWIPLPEALEAEMEPTD